MLAAALSAPAGAWAAPDPPPAGKDPFLVKLQGADVASLRTTYSQTFRTASGAYDRRFSMVPVNFKDADGHFHPISTALQPQSGGEQGDVAGPSSVQLPATLADPVKIGDDSRSVSFELAGASGDRPQVDGAQAGYDDVLSGVDAVYEALPNGVKETLSITDRSAPSSFAFDLTSSGGLHPVLRGGGQVELRDAAGVARFTLPAPTVQADGGQPTLDHVAYAITADGKTLTVKVDPDWLAHAALPVKIDPTVYQGNPTACTLQSAAPSTSLCNGSTVQVGKDAAGVKRAVFRFPGLQTFLDPDTNITVESSHMGVGFVGQTSSSAQPTIKATGLGHTLAAGATWNTYNGANAWSTAGGDTPAASDPDFRPRTETQLDPSYVGGWVSFDVSALAEQWIRDDSKNRGFELSMRDETASNVVTLNGPAASSYGPNMDVVYHRSRGSQRDRTYETVGIDDRSAATVDPASGNLAVNAQDIDLPGVNGLDLSIGRTYNADDLTGYGFGNGWSPSIDGASTVMDYTWFSGAMVLYANGGATYRFDRDPDHDTSTTRAFLPAPGLDATLTVDQSTFQTTVTFRDGRQWIYSDSDGYRKRLVQIRDAHNNHIDVHYDPNSAIYQLASIDDSHGRTLTFDYDNSGQIHSITDVIGRTWIYNQTYNFDPYEHVLLSSVTDPDGHITGYHYADPNVAGRVALLDKITDPRGHDITFGYSGDNEDVALTSLTRVVNGGTQDVSWSWNYNPAAGFGHACNLGTAKRTVETDPRGKLTSYCSNNNAQVDESYDALGRKQSKSYTALGNVTNLTQAPGTGNPLHISYNTAGSQTGTQAPSGETTAAGYCDPTVSTAPSGCSSIGNPSGGGGQAQYRATSATDEQGVVTNFAYTSAGDLTSVRDSNNPVVAQATLAYNLGAGSDPNDGTLKSSTDANGNVTSYGYNAQHELTSVTPPSSSTLIGATALTYDGVSRLASVTDGRGTAQTITHDGEDRVTQVTWGGAKTFVFTYDANGNVTKREEKNSPTGAVVATTTYGYDNLNRRTSETFPGSLSNTYAYDKSGNLSSLIDGSGTTSYTFDDINRLASITSPKSGTPSTDTIAYSYTDTSGVTGAPYQQLKTFPGGLKQEIDTDQSGKVVDQLIRNSSNSVLNGLIYSYVDGPNQRALVQSVLQQPAGKTTSYTYGGAVSTNLPRLTKAETRNTGGTVLDSWAYKYDANGNRTETNHSVGSTATPAGIKSYGYNAANELCWTATVAVGTATCTTPPTGASPVAYDKAGNQTTGGLGYDTLNRSSAFGSTALGYLSPTNDELTSFGTTGYQNALVGLTRQLPASGNSTTYVRQPDGTPVAQRVGTTKQSLFTDRLGSVVALGDDGTNALTSTYAYDPDGNRAITTTGTGTGAPSDLGFAGGHTLNNGATPTIHFGARYYNPGTAHWTQPDPISQVANPAAGGRYAYASGDPVNRTDLFGLEDGDETPNYACQGRQAQNEQEAQECESARRTRVAGHLTTSGKCVVLGVVAVAGTAIPGIGVADAVYASGVGCAAFVIG